MTFPLHRVHRESRGHGMIGTNQLTYTDTDTKHTQSVTETQAVWREKNKPLKDKVRDTEKHIEPVDDRVVFLLFVACRSCLGDFVVPLEVITGTRQTKCHSNTNSGKRTFSLYHYVKRLWINHIKATMLRPLCSHIFPSGLPKTILFLTQCS